MQALLDYLEYGKTEKPGRYQQQLDLEALASAIDARLATLNRTYTPADELGLAALQRWWEAVRMAERSYEDQLKGKLKSLAPRSRPYLFRHALQNQRAKKKGLTKKNEWASC